MKDSKLIKAIEKLSKSDLKRFREFVYSPFFNKRKTVTDLFDFIEKYAPNFEHKKLTQEYASKYIFPEEPYNPDAIIKLQSRLFKLLELFIYHHFKSEKLPDKEIALMQFYDENSLSTHFKNIYKRVQKVQQDYPYRDALYHYHQFRIEENYHMYLAGKYDDGKGDIHYEEVTKMLEIFYLSEKLTQLCLMINRQGTAKIDYNMVLMKEILNFLQNSEYKEIPVIALWHEALLLLTDKKIEHYIKLKNLLKEHGVTINTLEQRMLYTYLENCSKSFFPVRQQYYEELFDRYKMQLEDGVMYINGFLLPVIFRNIVTVALNLNQLDWIAQFLDHNKDKIAPEYKGREDPYNYCLARLYCKQSKFDAVLDIIDNPSFNDTKFGVRVLRTQVYYEKRKTHASMFEDMINSFRRFLFAQQKFTPNDQIQPYRDFVNIINKIYNTLRKDQQRLDDIEQQINETPILPEGAWLLEKLNELR